MKKLLLCIICCSLFHSCDPEWVYNPPYQSEWLIVNNTNRELQFYWEGTYIDSDSKQDRSFRYDHFLTNDDFFYQAFHGFEEATGVFTRLFCVSLEEELKSCRFYITPSDSDEILREWVMGTDNGAHDLFDESQWEHRSWEDTDTASYTIYHNEWTFTLTEADIAVAE